MAGRDQFIRAISAVTIPDFVWESEGLDLSAGSIESLLMSLLWNVTKDGMGGFQVNQRELAERFGISRKSVNENLRSLVGRGYVSVVSVEGNPRTGIRTYAANLEACEAAVRRLSVCHAAGASAGEGLALSYGDAVTTAPPVGSGKTAQAAPESPVAASAGPSPAQAADDDASLAAERAYRDLRASWPRPTARKYAEDTRAAYDALVRDGFTPIEIAQAAEDYIEQYQSTHDSADGNKYLQYLRTFLANDNGARHYILNARRDARREAARARQCSPTKDDLVASAHFVRAISGASIEWLARLADGRLVDLPRCSDEVTTDDLRGILAKTLAGG